MKTQLSSLLSVAEACRILGEDQVQFMIRQLLTLKQRSPQFQHHQQQQQRGLDKPPTEEVIRKDAQLLAQAMFYSANNSAIVRDTTSPLASVGSAAVAVAAKASALPTKILPSPSIINNSAIQFQNNRRDPMAAQISSHQNQQQQVGVPPPIRQAWQRLTSRRFMFDKMALIKFSVPVCVQPHTGVHGHMGLFDCLMYAMQHKPGTNSAGNPNNGSIGTTPAAFGPPLIALPDLIIVLAICKQYRELMETDNIRITVSQKYPDSSRPHYLPDTVDEIIDGGKANEGGPSAADASDALENETGNARHTNQRNGNLPPNGTVPTVTVIESDDPRIEHMARWMFVVYDAFQKKGLVSRDTIQRFLSDVHGEDSYKGPTIRTVLDRVFANAPSLTSRDFVRSIQATTNLQPRPSHILMDWMAMLASALEPPSGGIPESTFGFLKQIDQELRLLPQICNEVGLAESRLYEIKRRFHSLVEAGSNIIQGDPMSEEAEEEPADTSTDVVQEASMGRRKPQSTSQMPKHVISKGAFCRAICPQNDELGHGGYLPQMVALQVFSSVATADQYWDLTHVLRFGGAAVRSDDKTTVQWIVRMVGDGRSVLNRQSLCQLMLCLCEHHEFRTKSDAPKDSRVFLPRPSRVERRRSVFEPVIQATEETLVKRSTAMALGLLPNQPGDDDSRTDVDGMAQLSVGVLVDEVFRAVATKGEGNAEEKANDSQTSATTMSIDELLDWHCAETATPKDRRRLGPLMTELRLIASVLFGVPPRLASLEHAVVAELTRRHKTRYPQNTVSRRGPKGTVWYLIDDVWYKAWNGLIKRVSFAADDGIDFRDKPAGEGNPRHFGPINNTKLLRDNGSLALRADINWRHDYEILPPLVWSALQAWYDGGPPIHRTVVPNSQPGNANVHSKGASSRVRTENEIELYPLFVSVFMCDATSRGEARPFQQLIPISRVTPVRVLLLQLCKGLDIDPDLGRLWVMENNKNTRGSSAGSLLSASAASMIEDETAAKENMDWLLQLDRAIVQQRHQHSNMPLTDKQMATLTLLLEVKDEDSGKWPRGINGTQWEFKDKKETQPELGDGIVGLYNMGNTCYLNASIQCLSHTPIFRDYFNAKCHLNDINKSNPLGHKGQLAQVSAVLINSLWKRFNQQPQHIPKRIIAPGSFAIINAPALTPKTFKESLGHFSEHFSGNEQHDAQELLAFILGGLSEDLNRIVDKPYIEAPDSDGRPDSELADIWWSNHLKREMSIIVALFTGQYKSLLTCRTCKYESARFEPYSFLQLPLPEDDHISVSLILYPIRDGAEVMRYALRVKNNGKLHDVLIALARILHTDELAEATGNNNNDDAIVSINVNGNENGAADTTDNGDELQSTTMTEAQKKELEQLCHERAKNMAVVDMMEGYIFKIAPNSWALSDLQNKDTGELPLLHVYELDPPLRENASKSATEATANSSSTATTAATTTTTTTVDATVKEAVSNTRVKEDDDDDVAPREDKVDVDDHKNQDTKDAVDDINNDVDVNGTTNENYKDNGNDSASDSDTGSDDDDEPPINKEIFLAVAQRRSEEVARHLLHPLAHRVFGTPMLLRIPTPCGITGSELYDFIAKRLRNFVPKNALKFLTNDRQQSTSLAASSMIPIAAEPDGTNVVPVDTAGTGNEDANDATTKYKAAVAVADGKTGKSAPNGTRRRLQKTMTDMESVAAGDVPRYGFRLRITSRDGKRCALCPWYECCIGCLVPDDGRPTVVTNGDSVVIDWHLAVDLATSGFGTRRSQIDQVSSQTMQARSRFNVPVKNHPSCGVGSKRRGYANAITLEDCLDQFAKEEKIPEAYCSCCKEFRVQTKTMSLWRLPPIVIIQLKRFQFTQHMRRKLRDFVAFPVEGLDLSRIISPDSHTNVAGKTNLSAADKGVGADATKPTASSSSFSAARVETVDEVASETNGNDGGPTDGVNDRSDDSTDGEAEIPEGTSPLAPETGRSEMLYDLYGVVHHQGALSGGHYVASLKSEVDGQWRLFNDAQIFEIHESDVVDSSAYILFYIRRDVKTANLSDFWDTRLREDGEGISEEDADKLMRGRSDRCVIS